MTIQVETKYYYTPKESNEKLEVITPDRVHPSVLGHIPVSISIQLSCLNRGISLKDINEFLALTSPKKKEPLNSKPETLRGRWIDPVGVYHYAIDSNVISYARYDMKKRELFLRFKHGGEYVYFNVPFDVLINFLNSSSKGVFFNAYIRDKFDTAKFIS